MICMRMVDQSESISVKREGANFLGGLEEWALSSKLKLSHY
jgi:hypothetical protein